MLGSINLELLWLEMYNLWWRISFPTVFWQLPKTCLQTSSIPWKCFPYYRMLHRPTTEGIVWGSISFDSRTLLVIISSAHKTQWYLDYILRPVFCCSSCVIPRLTFQLENASTHTVLLWIVFNIAEHFVSQLGHLISPPQHISDVKGRRLQNLRMLRIYIDSWKQFGKKSRRTLSVYVATGDNLNTGQRGINAISIDFLTCND